MNELSGVKLHDLRHFYASGLAVTIQPTSPGDRLDVFARQRPFRL